jgi:citrate synthase
MRGIKGLWYDTSKLDANKGITFRGYTIPDLAEKLPHAKGGQEALPEGAIWLLYGDSIPTKTEFNDISTDLKERSTISEETMTFIKRLPTNLHPLTQLSSVMLFL